VFRGQSVEELKKSVKSSGVTDDEFQVRAFEVSS
jgi:hypothetical protein